MVKAVLIIITILFAVSGLCEFIHSLRLFFILPEKDRKSLCIIKLEPQKAVQQVKFVLEQSNWLGSLYAERIVAVCDGIDGAELEICRKMVEESEIMLCTDGAFEFK
ncbi:MAG: hypothetical protein MJ076_05045 [Clostridia bacterium]|nr:hypothetical protein [Clostridia bacterium]